MYWRRDESEGDFGDWILAFARMEVMQIGFSPYLYPICEVLYPSVPTL